MKGSFSISVQNNTVKYAFSLKRNITIIQGDSATGKTTLVDLIREYEQNGTDSGISLSCEKKCRVLEGNDWNSHLSLLKNCIIFIDEGNRFVESKEFASEVKKSDNYFVIVTREGLENLPYSIEEIYGIHTSGKYSDLKQVYHEFYKIYGNFNLENKIQKLITEDSNSGFDFFNSVSQKKYICESAGGRSNIYKKLLESGSENVLAIVDGAAFGSQMNLVSELLEKRKNLSLFVPESFEWIILKSGVVKDVEKILEHPEDFADSTEFFSWEQFFTKLLTEKTKGTYLKYLKRKLNPNYLSDSIKNKILNLDLLAFLQNSVQ